MLNFLDTVDERMQQAGFSPDYQAEVDKLQAIVKDAKTTKKITLERPFFGGDKTQKVPLLRYLDIMFFSLSRDVLQKKFEEDGDFHEGSGVIF